MEINYTPEELIAFEDHIVNMYRQGKIKSPLHLSGGNEKQVIEIFKEVNSQDFVFTTYRSHYHALLKGVPHERVRDWVLANKSIHFMDSEYGVFSSAIVGGTLPIALGMALSLYLDGNPEQRKVWCFIGDMTASLGVFKDCLIYALNFKLPIKFVIENNGLSTDTKTHEVWGITNDSNNIYYSNLALMFPDFIRHYIYTRTRPHYGIGEFVIFDDQKSKDSGRSF